MHSIETINAINSPEHEELTAAELAEKKARAWIEKGVRRALRKALWEVGVEIAGALDEYELPPEARAHILAEIHQSERVLRDSTTINNLTAAAWHGRRDDR